MFNMIMICPVYFLLESGYATRYRVLLAQELFVRVWWLGVVSYTLSLLQVLQKSGLQSAGTKVVCSGIIDRFR